MSNKTYAGIEEEYSKLESSKIVLIPVPYDGTSTWQKGADKGPEAFLNASENMILKQVQKCISKVFIWPMLLLKILRQKPW